MARAIVSRRTLDTLIRAKLATFEGCDDVKALPVMPHAGPDGCNWSVPGWTGGDHLTRLCIEQIGSYLSFLKSQFNIPVLRPVPRG